MGKAKLAGISLKPMQQTEKAFNKQGKTMKSSLNRDIDAMVRRAMKPPKM